MIAYYDVDEILADAQKVPCRFNIDIPAQGALDGRPGEPIKAPHPLPLPFALADSIASNLELSAHTPLDIHPPPHLSDRVLNALHASPLSVSLRHQNPYFYASAQRLLGPDGGIEDSDARDDDDEYEHGGEDGAQGQSQSVMSQQTGLSEEVLRRIGKRRRRDLRMVRGVVEAWIVRAGLVGDLARGVEGRGGGGAGGTGGAGGGKGVLGEEFLAGLEERERFLFRCVHERAKEVRGWMIGEAGR